ncbi:hypothetical protein N431DRAFT_111665 [Stipitochalara longipes BDJ]|nr:hypothetical protein N431DRAFT_111665 [Stipitochalara longipes BDJ]
MEFDWSEKYDSKELQNGSKAPAFDMFAISCIAEAECRELGDLFRLESDSHSSIDLEACKSTVTHQELPQTELVTPQKPSTRRCQLQIRFFSSWRSIIFLLFGVLFLAAWIVMAIAVWYCWRDKMGHGSSN